MEWLLLLLCVVVLTFGLTLFFGAPYLPTLRAQVPEALDLLQLKAGDTLIEIGSGDGRILAAAAGRGLLAVGYEINPILVIISRMRLRKYRGKARVIWGNALTATWPPAQGLYVFGITKIMPQLHTKIMQFTQKHGKPLRVVSFGFPMLGKREDARVGALFCYTYPRSRG